MLLKKQLFTACALLSLITGQSQTITDVDGNTYNTVTIGNQVWMQENLRTTHFNNGILISTTTLSVNNDSTSVFQWPFNNDVTNVSVYGRLYTWYAVAGKNNVCPAGWHVPDNSEWEQLANFLGGDSIAGGKMKETGTTHWTVTNVGVTNSSSFNGLPGGFRGNPSGWNHLTGNGFFWSTTPFGSGGFQRGYHFDLHGDNNNLTSAAAVSNCGMSVRCVQEKGTGIRTLPLQDQIRLSPNPATTELTLEFERAGERQLSVYDAKGSLVLHLTLTGKLNSIPLSTLDKGIYLLRIVDKGLVSEKKFVKQ